MNTLGIRNTVISMRRAGMTDIQAAFIVQEIHAWAIFHERIRTEALYKENPPKFLEISELRYAIQEII